MLAYSKSFHQLSNGFIHSSFTRVPFEGKVLVKISKIEELRKYAENDEELARRVSALQTVQISEVFEKYVGLMQQLSDKNSDRSAEILFDCESHEVLFEEIAQIDNGLVHIFRNCFDHGIEDQTMRSKKGKPAIGKIFISCFRRNDGFLHLILKDNGAGIDTEKIYRIAREKGILTKSQKKHMSDEDRVYLIFKDSLSSKNQATDLSGRGVGMSAVQAQIKSIGGQISVFSHPGQGTQFEIDIPPLKK